eukprot:4156653-Heterocapsa_arctica.AAC.1
MDVRDEAAGTSAFALAPAPCSLFLVRPSSLSLLWRCGCCVAGSCIPGVHLLETRETLQGCCPGHAARGGYGSVTPSSASRRGASVVAVKWRWLPL